MFVIFIDRLIYELKDSVMIWSHVDSIHVVIDHHSGFNHSFSQSSYPSLFVCVVWALEVERSILD